MGFFTKKNKPSKGKNYDRRDYASADAVQGLVFTDEMRREAAASGLHFEVSENPNPVYELGKARIEADRKEGVMLTADFPYHFFTAYDERLQVLNRMDTILMSFPEAWGSLQGFDPRAEYLKQKNSRTELVGTFLARYKEVVRADTDLVKSASAKHNALLRGKKNVFEFGAHLTLDQFRAVLEDWDFA
jgi:hypothetical protein